MRGWKLLLALVLLNANGVQAQSESVRERALRLTREFLLVDTHVDVPYRLMETWADVTGPTEGGQFDLPRARSGGLDLPFMSIFTPEEPGVQGGSFQLANQLIDSVEALVGRAPDAFRIVTTPGEAGAAKEAGQIGLALGMENGSPLDGDVGRLKFFRDRGISYITLAHSLSNDIADSSYDTERPNGGLSTFGRQVVREMNRLGILVDVSHVSDEAFWQVIDTSRAPVIASHSSARHFTPGFERNMSDEMIQALAAAGGVIMINFGSSFLTEEAHAWFVKYSAERAAWLYARGFAKDSPEAKRYRERYREQHPIPYAHLADVVKHFEHVITLVGVEHVGIGSDFEGVGDSLPVGLKDVSDYPNLVAALLEAGHSEEDIRKILGGNLLRVWGEVLDVAGGS